MRYSLSSQLNSLPFLVMLFPLVLEGVSSGAPLTLDEYRSRIRRSIEVLRSEDQPFREEEHLKALQKQFPQNLKVCDQRGDPILIDGQTMGRWMEEAWSSSEGRERLLRHFVSLLDQTSWPAGGHRLAESDWDKSRLALDKVYSAREFRHLRSEKPPRSRWDTILTILKRIKSWIEKYVGSIEGVSFGWIPYAFYGLLIIAGGWVFIWIIRSSGPVGWRWRQWTIRRLPGGRETVPEPDWQGLRSEAQREAREGAFREAVRAFFLSVLMEGQGRGWWTYRPEATNKEHLASVKGPEERWKALSELIDLYEKTWYGLKEPDEKAFVSCTEWLRRMEAARDA